MRIEWGLPGERTYEVGIDRGVLYPRTGPGVPWNGLVSVNENTSGGDPEPFYKDGVKYMDLISSEDFAATIEAYSAPAEFAACDGTKALSPGLFATQQPRKSFSLSYRTLIGNDLEGVEYGYKLHIVYNATAAPSSRTNQTTSDNTTPGTRQWNIATVPPPATTFKPTAHFVIDSTKADPYFLEEIESYLYGREGFDARLPSQAEIVTILGNRIEDTIGDLI